MKLTGVTFLINKQVYIPTAIFIMVESNYFKACCCFQNGNSFPFWKQKAAKLIK